MFNSRVYSIFCTSLHNVNYGAWLGLLGAFLIRKSLSPKIAQQTLTKANTIVFIKYCKHY